ncbi:hypothetical protein D3C81_1552620 [compost metagenome]
MGWNILEELIQRLGTEPGAGRVVRVGDEDHTGLAVDGRQHGRQVMPPGLGRNDLGLGTDCLSDDRVDRKGMLAEYRIQARRQVRPGDQFQNVVGTVAQGDLVHLDIALLGQPLFEGKAVAIGVAGQFGERIANGRQGLGAGAQRILVAGQLDDAGRIDIQLARQLIDRLAWNVRRQLLHARQGEGEEITHG